MSSIVVKFIHYMKELTGCFLYATWECTLPIYPFIFQFMSELLFLSFLSIYLDISNKLKAILVGTAGTETCHGMQLFSIHLNRLSILLLFSISEIAPTCGLRVKHNVFSISLNMKYLAFIMELRYCGSCKSRQSED